MARPVAVEAHRDGCHRWHSCPSDSGSYECGDSGYACRYPTYSESQRGQVYDPTYEDYGGTDRGAPDYDYSRIVDGIPAREAPASPYDETRRNSVERELQELSPDAIPVSSSDTDGGFPWGWIAAAVGVVLLGAHLYTPSASASGRANAGDGYSQTQTPHGSDEPTTTRRSPSRPPARKRVSPKQRPANRPQLCQCGGRMVVRTRRRDGHKFLGCSNFPRCRQTRSL